MRSFYIWMLPAIWAAAAVVSFFHPGDEYGLFVTGTIAGSWICAFMQQIGHPRDVLWIIMVVGIAILGLLGFGMDKLRVSKRAWGLLFVSSFATILAFSLLQFPSLERAIGKNGSITAYAAWATNMGLYLSIVLALIIRATKAPVGETMGAEAIEPIAPGDVSSRP